MPEKNVNVTLTFATDADPAALGARVVDVVVAEVAAKLTAATWHGFELDEDTPDTEDTDA